MKHIDRISHKSNLFIYGFSLQSLDYDVWENDILVKEEQSIGYYHIILRTNIIRWVLHLLTGLITGMIAVTIDYIVDHLFAIKASLLQNCILFI